MEHAGQILGLLAITFLLLTLVFNIKPSLPKFPWDVYINKSYLRVYLPVITSLVVAAALTVFFNFFRK